MIKNIKKLLENEIITYIIFGGLTTLVNFSVHFILSRLLGVDKATSNAVAVIISILFAYIVNKIFVFKMKAKSKRALMLEIYKFFSSRAVTMLFEMISVPFLTEQLGINDFIIKSVVTVLVIVVNYIFSKWLVFKK